jgi:hypothetical protein
MADIQFEADAVSIGGTRLQIPEEATLAVRSHQIVRLGEGASAGDRFFESRDGTWASAAAAVRAVQHALRAGERDTGLRMTRHHTSGRNVGVKNQARLSGIRLTCLSHDDSTAATQ